MVVYQVGYPLEDEAEAVNCTSMRPIFVPMQELEDLAPGTWYVNVLAAYPEHRGRDRVERPIAEKIALGCKKGSLSIIVPDANTRARRLVKGLGIGTRDNANGEGDVGESWM